MSKDLAEKETNGETEYIQLAGALRSRNFCKREKEMGDKKQEQQGGNTGWDKQTEELFLKKASEQVVSKQTSLKQGVKKCSKKRLSL